MKIFVLSKRAAVLYPVLVLLVTVVGVFSKTSYVSTNAVRQLPIYSVQREDKKISLTFDSAWEDTDTEKIIEVLNKYGVSATFFVTGDFVDRCPKSVKAFYDAGHEIANHSDMHIHPNSVSKRELTADTKRCDEKIKAVTGVNVPLYRAPYGEYNDSVVETITDMGYKFIQWDVDSLDYTGVSKENMLVKMDKVKDGSILLFHTGTDNTADALGAVIEKLQGQGYTFVKVSELIYNDNYYIDNTGRQWLNNAE